MNEPTSNAQATVECREASNMKRIGQTAIALFVLFVISLLSFGKAPFDKVTDVEGYRVNFNLISGLGVLWGVVAFVFLLVRFKRVLRLPTPKKALGLIGGFGLIAHTIFALFLPLSYSFGPAQGIRTGGRQPLAQSGSEEWVIDGRTYNIASTYYLRLPEGFQFTIEYSHRFSQAVEHMNDERALKIVLPLMKHAYRNNLYKRASVTKLGQGVLTPSRIGVVLFEKRGPKVGGYRVALSLDEIRKRIERDGEAKAYIQQS
jgi:hypothetical protein